MSDWTVKEGRSNSSEAFEDAVQFVERILATIALGSDLHQSARLIMARLAHIKNFGPLASPRETE